MIIKLTCLDFFLIFRFNFKSKYLDLLQRIENDPELKKLLKK